MYCVGSWSLRIDVLCRFMAFLSRTRDYQFGQVIFMINLIKARVRARHNMKYCKVIDLIYIYSFMAAIGENGFTFNHTLMNTIRLNE